MNRKKNTHKSWQDLSPKERKSVLTFVSIQLALAATAWTDLALRSPDEVRGRKGKWAAIIAINYVGPVLYFVRGIRRKH